MFIDFSKAFDTLRHDTLITKLDNTGVRGPLLNWCKDYLKNRKYRVKLENSLSDEIVVSTGTAQGSVLGPLHYLAYVNDMENVIEKCSVYQYADDTCLIAASKDISEAETCIQTDFTNLCKWSHDVGLVINSAKTKIMHVRSNHLPNVDRPLQVVAHAHECLHSTKSAIIKCNCDLLEQVTALKYLGLIIDNRFNWSQQVESICVKLRALIAKFAILQYKVPFPILLNMYKALVESIVSYGITSYGRTFKTYLDKIYNLQLRILKIIIPNKTKQKLYKKDYNHIELFKFCKILPIHTKIKMLIIIEQYHNKQVQININHKTITRKITQTKLRIPHVTNYYGKRSNKYLVPTLINEIPESTRALITEENYKRTLKKYFENVLQKM